MNLAPDLLSINRLVVQLVILLDDLPHRAGLHDPVLVEHAWSLIGRGLPRQLAIGLGLLLVKHLVNDVGLARLVR